MDVGALRAALRQLLITVSGLPSSRAWESVSFEPTVGTPYVREALLSPLASQDPRSLPQPGGVVEERSVYQISVYHPQNRGTEDSDNVVQAVLGVFRPGAQVMTTPHNTKVLFATVSPPLDDSDWRMVPVSVTLITRRTT